MLNLLQIRNLKPKDSRYELCDGNGLFLRVCTNGRKVWIINKRINGRRISRVLGEFPQMSIADARNALDQYVCVTVDTQSETFGDIYNEWIAFKKRTVKNWQDIDERIQKYLIPVFGNLPFDVITPPHIIKVLREQLETRGKLETIKRICGYIKELETYAVNAGLVNALRFQGMGKVFVQPKVVNRPSVHPSQLPEILKKLQTETLKARTTWDAIQIAFYTLLRPIEYCSMEWEWIHDGMIEVPAEVMKMKKSHVVPITAQLEKVLSDRPQVTEFVLTSPDKKDRHIRTASQEVFFRRHGLSGILVPHGIRSIGRTWMHENGIDNDVAEMCLAHRVGTRVAQAYDRTDLLDERREAMQKWCDFVESCLH